MPFIHLSETDSTNRWLRDHADDFAAEELTVVSTDHQTAGRGCGSNTWESERGQNLLFSVLCHPTAIPAVHQFLLLEAMALAVKDIIDGCLPQGESIAIKWPNDIYWHDRKLGGTLTECALSGQSMRWCIIGTGLNINQTAFSPQLPNPVSLAQITGKSTVTGALLEHIASRFGERMRHLGQGQDSALQDEYMAALYRRSGFHEYKDGNGLFEAETVAVTADGTLTLRDRRHQQRQYKFKEVSFVI